MDLHLHAVKGNESRIASPSLLKGFLNWDRSEQKDWFEENWTVSFYFVAAYLVFIYTGQEFMRNRKPLDLRKAIILWNILLASFSIAACYQILPEFYSIIVGENGVHKSVCASVQEVSERGVYWGWLFTLSKVLELGDTVFLVLKKRKLIFLHWYHHITVLLYCWYVYSQQISTARWFICVNYTVHAIMYTYYALRSLNVHINKKIAMSITSIQLSQMVIGVIVNVYAYSVKLQNKECDVSLYHLNFGLIMYASYFFLFAHFFYTAYLTKGKEQEQMKRRLKRSTSPLLDDNANTINITKSNRGPIRRMVKLE